ncbi:TetR/AcrR family transcriptional regulator [Saccharopolyspora phatthalungensis]|uniref:AcrR family transcriptional regulator n=1 Tax=Saccharopolyspora phatthalungensis TaxID=664693 RepID=A0A840Q8R5_9PSEU|nr:helix-turn-helix domain-containing protein [Saccharopolyspora phatthalungensis]MBB5156836.1 AcrR family transcriptional regulator [Saccharopolyspora phatthalungensis]
MRERKKRRTREAIMEAAFALFRESGFDGVAVVDIAAAAEVSKPTLFAYFPTKEDLVLRRFIDDNKSPALVVRERPPGMRALRALRQSFLDRLTQRDVLTGLNDSPPAITFHNLLYSTPTLMTRLTIYMLDQERDLSGELLTSGGLSDEFIARLVAAQVFGTHRILAYYNAQEMRLGHSADDTYPVAVARATTAFDLLERSIL